LIDDESDTVDEGSEFVAAQGRDKSVKKSPFVVIVTAQDPNFIVFERIFDVIPFKFK
jgi:hypothetical protein